MSGHKQRLWVVLGPTASGKTNFSVQLARKINAEIVVCDAYQIRKGLPLLTAKPSGEELSIPHHLLNEFPTEQPATVGGFLQAANRAIINIAKRGKQVVICGGTGLYLRSLLEGFCQAPPASLEVRLQLAEQQKQNGPTFLYEKLKGVDPKAAQRIHPNDYMRIERALEVYQLTGVPLTEFHQESKKLRENSPYEAIKIGLDPGRRELLDRIEKRISSMIDLGVVDEVKDIYQHYGRYDNSPIGYNTICDFIDGKIDQLHMREEIRKQTAHYAKRQRTWFKKETNTTWLDFCLPTELNAWIDKIIKV